VDPVRLLIAAPDARLLRAVAAVLDADCDVRTATTGLDCVRQLRAAPPDLLALIPPLLWGSESGVVAIVDGDPALHHVSVLLLPDPAAPEPSMAQYVPRETGRSPQVTQVVTRLCRCYREHYHLSSTGPSARAGLA
jgi:hypothetical protein